MLGLGFGVHAFTFGRSGVASSDACIWGEGEGCACQGPLLFWTRIHQTSLFWVVVKVLDVSYHIMGI